MTPKRWRQINEQIDPYYQIFQQQYGGDSGSFTYSDSGGSAPSVAVSKFVATVTANAPANLDGNGAALQSVSKLHRMGRSTGVAHDTGWDNGENS